MAEFTYNNASNATTGMSLFFANKGYHPEFTMDPQAKISLDEAQTFVVDLENIHAELKENIMQAQERYQRNMDKQIGDQAHVKVKFLRTG